MASVSTHHRLHTARGIFALNGPSFSRHRQIIFVDDRLSLVHCERQESKGMASLFIPLKLDPMLTKVISTTRLLHVFDLFPFQEHPKVMILR